MNLGDGLLFEVENGKAKLSVLSRGTEKNPAKVSCRPRAANILSSRQVSCLKEAQREEQPARRQAGRHREARRSRAEGAAAASSTSNTAAGGRSSTLTLSNTSKTQTNHTAECIVKAAPKVKLDRPKHSSTIQSSRATGKAGQLQNTVTLVSGKDTLANGEAALKENVVCLTSEQLQQILDTIQPSDSRQHPTEDQSTQGNETDSKTGSSVNKTEGDEGGDATGPAEPAQDKDVKPRGSLLSWLEDQQSTRRAVLDARRAQWRRELDEQVALKQQQSWTPGKRQAEVDTDSVLSVQSCSSHTEQPAAFGSNFRYGEALSQERREEQRRLWLEELDRQREEATQRRRQEKLLQRETDDFYHWAMHFDSLQKRPLVQAAAPPCLPPAPPALPAALHPAPPCLPPAPPALPAALHPAPPALPAALHPAPPSLPPAPPALPAALHPAPPSLPPAQAPAVGQDRGEWEAAPSSSLSLGWEVLSSCGAESAGRASVGTTSGYPARASHLRTMTALLDPTQIEERERRRLKQLEHQRALAAQAEERRLQREEEEARRREQEQEDERRVALEREKLQRQYQLEVQRERQRKDRLVHPSDDVSPSVQSAEQEEQKITRLTSNSHNVGNLQETQRPSEVNRPGQCLGEGGAGGEEQDDLDEVRSSVPRLKDTAVQTVPSVLDGAGMIHTPEVSAEQRPSPFSLPLPPPPPPPHSRRQAVRAGKENVCVSDPAGWGGDPYEPFARTERSRRDRRRPEWNTQRPRRRFVPASERYPAALQKNRQESRLRRQAELLALQDRACLSRTDPAPPPPPLPQLHQEPNLSPNPVQTRSRAAPTRKVESVTGGQRVPTAGNTERGRSPPIPALRHRQQRQKLLGSSSPPPPPPAPPPTLELVPYFRTEEIINLEPLELVSTPKPDIHTDAPQRTSSSSPLPPLRSPQRDPLLHNTRTYTQQQQEILRGLAQLRQGLLQEQRELEADNPLLKLRDNRLWSPLTTHRM